MLSLNHGVKPREVKNQQRALFDAAQFHIDPPEEPPPSQGSSGYTSPRLQQPSPYLGSKLSPSLRPSFASRDTPSLKSKSSHQSTSAMSASTTSSAQASGPGNAYNPPSPQRTGSGARDYIKNFSRRFERKPKLDINSLPQTSAPASQPGGGLSRTAEEEEDLQQQRQTQPGAQEPSPHSSLASPPSLSTTSPHTSTASPSTISSTLSSPRPHLRPPQPSRIQSQIYAATRAFKLPELPWLCGTWYITHSTLPMWADKRNVRVTYTRLSGDKLDDLVTFQQLLDPSAAQGAGVSEGQYQGIPASEPLSPPSSPGGSPRNSNGGIGSVSGGSGGGSSSGGDWLQKASHHATGLLKDPQARNSALEAAKREAQSTLEKGSDYYNRGKAGYQNPQGLGVDSVGAGDGSAEYGYGGAVGELKQVRGTDTVCRDGSYIWRGKGFGMLKSGTWEVLGWGGGGSPDDTSNYQAEGMQPQDPNKEQWIITYFGKTITSPAGISIYSRKKTGLSERKLGKLLEGLRVVDSELVGEGRGGSVDERGRGEFGRLVGGLRVVSHG